MQRRHHCQLAAKKISARAAHLDLVLVDQDRQTDCHMHRISQGSHDLTPTLFVQAVKMMTWITQDL